MERRPRLDLRKYRGQWVALDPKTRKVIARGRTLRSARAAAKRKGIEHPIFHGVPESDAYFVGSLR